MPAPDPVLRPARWATRVLFFCLGLVSGGWGVHVPTAKAHYALSEGGLALALLAAAVGAVLCLLLAGRLVHGLGARRAALLAGLAMSLVLALVLLPSHWLALGVLMVGLGASTALFDVAINAEGSALEARSRRKVMSGFHGMFSLGGMAGAALGAALIDAQVPAPWQLAGFGAAAALAVALASRRMLPLAVPDAAAPALPTRAVGAARRALLLLGALAGVGMVAEGAMYDWSVLFLKQELGASASFAALGYASFSAAMAAARFGGDWLREHVPPRRLMVGSALLAAASMAVALAVQQPWVAVVAYAGVGMGFANVVPILYLAASRVPGVAPAGGIAMVSSMGYLGFVAGPPLVGGLAHAASLTVGLAVVVAGALALAAGARRLPAA